MEKIMRFFRQNRKGILIAVLIIFFLFLILQRYITIEMEKAEKEEATDKIISDEIDTNKDMTLSSSESALSGEGISKSKKDKEVSTIGKFFNYCNGENIEEAYKMLTKECKEEMFSTVENFKSYYVGNIINETRVEYEIQNWNNSTYKVDIIPDMLSTGVSSEGRNKQDYITVIEVNGEYKLNINNYIGRTKINTQKEVEDLKIIVNYKDTYKEYEKYNITAQNNGFKKITLDNLQDVNSMYIEDRNEIQYKAYTHELTKESLELGEQEIKNVTIKYYSQLGSNKRIDKLVFSKVMIGTGNKYQKVEISV